MSEPIVIIGAGLSGLAAALELEAAGEQALILEASDRIGGKLKTDLVNDAYRLDLGFQVLLPAYPELRRFPDLESALELCYFGSGARLQMNGGSVLMANPLRHPLHLFTTALGRYGTLKDKLLVLRLQTEVQRGDAEHLLASASGSTLEYLRGYGFSEQMISSFWQPFFAGIFLESELNTAAGFFRYLTRMFATSPVAVPRFGIGEFPQFLAKKLNRSEIRLSSPVQTINGSVIELQSGEKIRARAVVHETQGHTGPSDAGPFGRVTSLWFRAPEPPFEGAWLSLNARVPLQKRLINHVAVLSNVSRDYALKGDALICVNVVEKLGVDPKAVLAEATEWFGPEVAQWFLLRVDEIARAFPLYVNRTDADTPSQQGALARGRRAAERVLATL